jgi:hypothetical protein
MTDKEIFDLAEKYGDWDDFGRWVFVDDDRLLRFVDAVNMSQKRVDETVKGEHKREWVGLDGKIPGLGLVTEEFYNGMIVAEDILREKNA